MEQTTPTRIALPLSALDAVVEAALEVSAVLVVPPCALEEQPPKTPAAIAAAMVRERTRVAFFIVSPSFFHVRSAFFSQISPDQTKSAQPRRQAGAARLCAKAKSLLFFLCFCLRNQNGVRSFCTADPVVLAPCLDCSDYSILPKFCKHFLSASGGFFRRLPYSIKLFLRFSSRIPVFAFFFSVKLSFGLNNFKIAAFPPHHWVMPGSGRPSPATLFRCFSPPYVVTALFIEEFLCQFLMSSKISHCFSLYRVMVLYRMFVLFCGGFFRHFPILYIL